MGQDRLNGLAMLFYNRHADITEEDVVEEFPHCHSRRILLVNPFIGYRTNQSYILVFIINLHTCKLW